MMNMSAVWVQAFMNQSMVELYTGYKQLEMVVEVVLGLKIQVYLFYLNFGQNVKKSSPCLYILLTRYILSQISKAIFNNIYLSLQNIHRFPQISTQILRQRFSLYALFQLIEYFMYDNIVIYYPLCTHIYYINNHTMSKLAFMLSSKQYPLLLTLCIICITIPVSVAVCPSNAQFLLVATNQCYATCPWQAPNYYYKYLPTNTCQLVCPGAYYGFDGNRSCTTTCPSSPTQTYYDTVNKRCVNVCPANYFGYLGADTTSNQKCVANCPSGTYADFVSSLCVIECPVGTYYMLESSPKCMTRCPNNYYGSPINRTCMIGGSCPSSPVRYYADDLTNLCVLACPANYFGDSATGRCLVYCSNTYFGDDSSGVGVCVQNCAADYYRDNVTRRCVRTCSQGQFINTVSLNCTTQCPSSTYGDNVTKKCVAQCPVPTYGDPLAFVCSNSCPYGYYADNNTQACVSSLNCYGNTVGDPTTNKCVNISACPSTPYYYADLTQKLCVLVCPASPNNLFGDKTTKTCVTNCPWSPPYYVSYKQTHTRECVTQCPTTPVYYASNLTKTCQLTCPQYPAVAYNTYADATTQQCVQVCPNGFVSQGSPDFICVSQCASTPTILYYYAANQSCIGSCPADTYADITKQMCVSTCPSVPSYFGYSVTHECVTDCIDGYFADQSTRRCVQACPITTLQYGDISTNYCVDVCPMIPDLYGQDLNDGNRTCVSMCQVGYFSDPLTRTCVRKCNMTQGYFGDTVNRRCVLQCMSSFADNTTGKCVSVCPSSPQVYFGNPNNKQCVLKCPQFLYANNVSNLCVIPTSCQTNYYADDFSQFCVSICPVSQSTFGQLTSRRCVKSCPQTTFADNTTRKCSSSCNTTAKLYKDPARKQCVYTCSSVPMLYANPLTMTCQSRCTSNYYAYDVTKQCVQICPSTPSYYGDLNTYRCLLQCPRQYYRFVNNTFRGCLAVCPPRVYTSTNVVDLYADNSTWTCVPLCPITKNLYNFKHPTDTNIRKCVLTCPMVGSTYYFAENVTRSCVTVCPTLTHYTYGDIFTSKCESTCTRNQYRDNSTKRCTYGCTPGTFADNTTWDCVAMCPSGYYGQTINNTCQRTCPTGYYAQFWTRLCRTNCLQKWYWYSDNTTAVCVRDCPVIPNMFANPDTRQCNYFCTGTRYADNNTGRCVPAASCSDGQIAEPYTKRCVYKCPIAMPSYLNNVTNECIGVCPTGGYADNSTMRCVAVCPSSPDLYAYNHTTKGPICILYCPALYYSHIPTRQCLQLCPTGYNRDTLTMTCVQVCPDHYLADTTNRICISNCSTISQFAHQSTHLCKAQCPSPLFADPTTSICVGVCTFGYFGQNGVCVPTCTTGFADPITKVCQANCTIGYFAKLPQRVCVLVCNPQYALMPQRTCITNCPVSSTQSLNMYYEPLSYTCVYTCLQSYYADNNTRTCSPTCSTGLFADNSTGRCVSKCPLSPALFGFNLVCYITCPNTNHFAQNISRQCIPQCPVGSYADSRQRRCMDICSGVQYGYVNTGTGDRLCVDVCITPEFGYWPNKTCVPTCPGNTYGLTTTRMCVSSCPSGTFADINSHTCAGGCQALYNEYGDPSTNKCVQTCPIVPSLYAQDNGRICVPVCEPGWYRLNTTRKCVQNCPSDPPLYADTITGYCVYKCQIDHNLYADNKTRTCSPTCPNITDAVTGALLYITYADDSTKRCVRKCPSTPRLYGYNQTNRCLNLCPTGTYGDNDTRICHNVCFFGNTSGPTGGPKYTWADPLTHFCTQNCTRQTFADNVTGKCQIDCTLGTYAENSTWRCVVICPVNPLSFAYLPTKKCIYQCPPGYFGNEDGRLCSTSCPTSPFYYYKDNQRNRCAKNCTYPYFADTFTQSCSTVCQFGYFQNVAQATCQKCPSSCISCQAALNCTSCQPSLYMHSGQCISSCPTFPVRLFADDQSSTCIAQCVSPYFGFVGTGKCQVGCPQTYYSDTNSGTCKLCPTGCRFCLATNCSSCLQGYIYSQAGGMCSKGCNTTHVYYNVDKTCNTGCIDGTFLLNDLVTCQSCSIECLTCYNVGTNCTTCYKKFWYNYMCVEKCPDRYYADANYKCEYCGDTNQYCSQVPLTYSISTYTQNYKLFAKVQFNKPVNMSITQFVKFIQIKSKNKAIKPSQFITTRTSGSAFTIQFRNSTSLNQMALSFGFSPGFVVDSSGGALTTSVVTVNVDTIIAVSPETEQKTITLTKQVSILSWILISVIFIMMIKYSYPLLILIDTVQLFYMHLFVILQPLPYMWFNVNNVLGYFHFNFLPKIYQYDTTTSPKQQHYALFHPDTTFLGNMQPFIFFVSIYCGIYLIVWLLTLQKINRFDKFREKVKQLYKARFRYTIIFEAFYITLYYVLFHALYQLKGFNDMIDAPVLNKALSIITILIFLAFIIAIIIVSSRTRGKILQVPNRIQKKKPLPKMPSKYKFLIYEPSQFPLEIAIRTFLKICICIVLVVQNTQVQLILLMVFNLIFLCYISIFKPSLYKFTNRLNILLSAGFIAFEAILFAYTITEMSSEQQNTTSIACLAIQCIMICGVIIWMIYRLAILIADRLFDKKYSVQFQVSPEVAKKHYGAIKQESVRDITAQLKKNKIQFDGENQKQINVSQLNIQDQENQQQTVNPDNLIKEFAYHFVPQKTDEQVKNENKLLGIKPQKIKMDTLVIEVDEDELVDKNISNKKEFRPTSTRKDRLSHLKIEENYNENDLDSLGSIGGKRSTGSKDRLQTKDRKKGENQVIWSNLDINSDHQSQL